MNKKKENNQSSRLLVVCLIALIIAVVGILNTIHFFKTNPKAKYIVSAISNTGSTTTSSSSKGEKNVDKQIYPKNIIDSEEIPPTLLESLKNQSEDVIKAYIAEKWIDEEDYNESDKNKLLAVLHQRLDKLEYIGYYLTVSKEENLKPANSIYLIYKVYGSIEQIATYGLDKSSWSSYRGNVNYYTYVKFDDIQLLENGSGTANISKYETPDKLHNRIIVSTGTSYGYSVSESDYIGYTDIMSFENECLVSKLDKYSYESKLDEKKIFTGEDGDKSGVQESDSKDLIENTPRYKEEQ